MSWKASAWAKQQRLGSPAAKSILMCLGDFADPNGLINGWASQAQLADDAEVSERSVREWMTRLEDWGLMTRRRQSRANGARAVDIIQLHLDRTLTAGADKATESKAGEASDGDALPAESAGRAYRQPDADLPATGDHPTGTEFRAHKEEPPLSYQSPPVEREARASEREEGEPEAPEPDDRPGQSREQLERRFWKLAKSHPGSAGMPKKPWLEAWLKLDGAERDRAERRHAAWLALLKAQSKSHVPALSTYFAEKLFDDVADAPEQPEPTAVEARPFGPLWAALVVRELLSQPQDAPPPPSAFLRDLLERDDETGTAERLRRQAAYGWPQVNAWYRQAESRRGFAARICDQPMAELVAPVPVDGAVLAAWRAEFERRGWPWLPDWGGMPVVYLPKGGPDALGEFEQALARIGAEGSKDNSGDDDGQRQAAE